MEGKDGHRHSTNQTSKEALATHYDLKAADIGTYFQGGDGHFAPDHPWLIQNGVQAIIDGCRGGLEKIDYKNDPDCIKKKIFTKQESSVPMRSLNLRSVMQN